MASRSVILIEESDRRVDRRVYELSVPNHKKMIAIETTDEVTVLGVARGKVRYRGQISTAIAEYFLNATRDIMPNFLINTDKYLLPNMLLGEFCEPIPVKFIVRRYLTGSLYEEYVMNSGETPWGKLEDGLSRYHQFKELQLTPMLRITTGEYVPVTENEIVAMGVLKPEAMDCVREKCFELFMRGEFFASKVGLCLADTTFELGWNVHGGIMVIDELLTPDCSRYWQSQNEPYSDENPPRAEKSSEYLSSWVRRKAEKLGVHTDEISVPASVRREAFYAYGEIYWQLIGLRFSPVKTRDTMVALRNYLISHF